MQPSSTIVHRAIVGLALAAATFAQDHAGEVVVPKTQSAIAIDGKAEEPAWAKAAGAGPEHGVPERKDETTHDVSARGESGRAWKAAGAWSSPRPLR